MSIKTGNFHTIEQNFDVPSERKILYGEVNTPYSIITEMIYLLPKSFRSNPNNIWFDPACGSGYYPIMLYKVLMDELVSQIPNELKRSNHIVNNMLRMNEINPYHIARLKEVFSKKAKIDCSDFLSYKKDTIERSTTQSMCIIGNPPYNCGGLMKTPTNTVLHKKNDGKAVWKKFLLHSIDIMEPGDYLCMIVPSLWMKPDKEGIYDVLCKYKLHNIRCFSNTETNKLFHNKAQTPTCFFLLQKIPNDFSVSLYTSYTKKYESYIFYIKEPLPLCGCSIISKVKKFAYMYGILPVIKTNMPRKHITLTAVEDNTHPYRNIHTCVLENKVEPKLVVKYSNEPCVFHNTSKLVLAHKMYGFPYYDKDGIYGISNRDNYVITGNYCDSQFRLIQAFLSTKLARYIFETTRYRMKFLEKYAFSFIPDIVHIPCSYTETSPDNVLYELFDLNKIEINAIETLHSKDFHSFLTKN